MILELLLYTQMIWMIFIKLLKNTIQIKKRNILIVFDDMIAHILSNKNLNPTVTKLFIRGRKLNISLVFITKSDFPVLKNIRLNSKHYFVMKFLMKMTFKTLWMFKKVYCRTVFFWLLILFFHQIILHVLENIF